MGKDEDLRMKAAALLRRRVAAGRLLREADVLSRLPTSDRLRFLEDQVRKLSMRVATLESISDKGDHHD